MWKGLGGWLRQLSVSLLVLYILFFGGLFLLFIYHSGSQTTGLSPNELSTAKHVQNVSTIFKYPIDAPHDLLIYGLSKIGLARNFELRLGSAVFAEIFVICFYWLARSWFGKSIGILGTAVLATTPLFLISSRQASGEIMLFSITAIMAAYLWLTKTEKKQNLAFILLGASASMLLYTPGIIWWIAGSLIFARQKLIAAISLVSKKTLLISSLVAALLLVPLVLAIAKDWTVIKTLAMIPTQFTTPIDTLKHLAWMILALFIQTPHTDNLIIARQPLLNLIQITFLVFGLYAMTSVARIKSLALLASVSLGILAAGFNNNIGYLAIGVPAIAIFITAGLRYLYIEWRSIFPRNPVAKYLALFLMSGVVIVQLSFGLRYSLIAWPHTMSTKSTYVLK